MKEIILRHKNIWAQEFTWACVLSFLFYICSMIVNYYASLYATIRQGSAVTDIVLSNVRVIDTDGIIIFGSLFLILFTAALVINEPKRIPFVLKSLALFILIRSIFIMLTHIGPFNPIISVDHDPRWLLLGLTNGADLFFSGHTGIPFLAALTFWHDKRIRYVFLVGSIILGISVLLAHLHYTIDVISAFFITYSIFSIAKKLFLKDWQRANS